MKCLQPSQKLLEDIRVVDITQGLCGPHASQLLGDAGAEVIKVEPPGGDYARRMPPFIRGESAAFLTLNRNKKSLALDITQEKGCCLLRELVRRADIFIEDLGPGMADKMGLGYKALEHLNPRLIYCAITPFGEKGPLAGRAGSELVLQAMTDYPNTLGKPGQPPERMGADIANLNTAILAFNTILGVLFQRFYSGEGQRVSVSMFGTLLYHRGILWAVQSDPDEWIRQQCTSYVDPPSYGYETKDGRIYFYLRKMEKEEWQKLIAGLGMTEKVQDDPRFANEGHEATGSGRYAHEVRPIWEEAFKKSGMGTGELLKFLGEESGREAVPVNDYESLFAHPQVQGLDIVREIKHPTAGNIKAIASPWRFSDQQQELMEPPPLLGQHTAEVLSSIGCTPDEISQLKSEGIVAVR